jgi:phosphatidylserine decarboxylase
MKDYVRALGLVPQNAISYAVGAMVRLKLPGPVQTPINKAFVKLFGINMTEAEHPVDSYDSIEAIFTRALQPNQRAIEGGYVSSADGVLEMSKPVETPDQAVQAKGLTYSMSELIYGKATDGMMAKWYTTVYLAPHNYHRVHSPFAGKVIGLRYIPGRLWPVNRPAVRAVRHLFCRNERLVFDYELDAGGRAWVVMVGAFNVGRMVTPLLPNFVTNAAHLLLNREPKPVDFRLPTPFQLKAGDEIGTFMLGSTTVVVLDEVATKALRPRVVDQPLKVVMGQDLA